MLAVFINPGRRPDQPEPPTDGWGDRNTNRPTEYNSLDDRYARVICEELLPVLSKEYNISKDPQRCGIGGRKLGRDRRLHRRLGAARSIPQSPQHRRQLHQSPRRACLSRKNPRQREKAAPRLLSRRPQRQSWAPGRGGNYNPERDWFLQNVRLVEAMTEEGL
jgi:enterochelin esterase family protein